MTLLVQLLKPNTLTWPNALLPMQNMPQAQWLSLAERQKLPNAMLI
jgi:hypothetical protein